VTISATPVQQAVNAVASSTPTVTLGSAVTAGNFLALCIRGNNYATSAVSGGGCTWSAVTNDGSNVTTELWKGVGSTGGGTVITLTRGGVDTVCMNVSEWSGVAQSAPQDQLAHSGGSSTTPAPGAITPAQNAELVVACFASTNQTGAAGGGFTNLTNSSDGSSVNVQGAYKVIAGGGAQTASWTITSASWGACVGSFKATAAALGSSQAVVI
jgi:hypothetical protein